MSEKNRKKKDGHDKGKENEAMHESEHERREKYLHDQHSPQSDQKDLVHYKQGSANDRTPKSVSPTTGR